MPLLSAFASVALGKYVMAFVYDSVDGHIGKKLRAINPDPHFQQNHHQWLKEFGRQKVHDQIDYEALRRYGRLQAQVCAGIQENCYR